MTMMVNLKKLAIILNVKEHHDNENNTNNENKKQYTYIRYNNII